MVDTAYEPASWQSLYGAVAGASASLTGLLFVALSVNRRAIMGSHQQEARALETLGTLLSLLVVSIVVLVPGQDHRAVGLELALVGVLLVVAGGYAQRRTLGRLSGAQRRFWIGRLVILDAGTAAVVIGGASCAAGRLGGLFWLVPTLLIYFLWAATNAWVLLLHEPGGAA